MRKAARLGLFAAAVAGGDIQLALASQQSESEGFIGDTQLKLTLRNYYFNHNKGEGRVDGRDWAQAAMFDWQSGFTKGAVGFGVDAFAHEVIKLSERGGGGNNLMVDKNGDSHSFGHVGAAVKMRLSNTVLKYGDMQPYNPVFAAGGLRITPQTARGWMVQSDELPFTIQAGRFTSGRGWQNSSNSQKLTTSYGNTPFDSASFIGADYTINKYISTSLYASRYEDLWDRYYGGVNYKQPLTDSQALNFGFNIYRTVDQGQAKAGQINNTAWSLAGAYTISAHTIKLAYQQVRGSTPFDYLGFGSHSNYSDSIWLSNSVQYSDFNGPGEKSIQLRYDIDMSVYGIPGLSFMVRSLHGHGIDGTNADPNGAYAGYYGKNDREKETDMEAKYVMQSGPFKDLSFRVRQAWHRGDASTGGSDDYLRIMIEYPLDLAGLARR